MELVVVIEAVTLETVEQVGLLLQQDTQAVMLVMDLLDLAELLLSVIQEHRLVDNGTLGRT
jgi:hypothetical protein